MTINERLRQIYENAKELLGSADHEKIEDGGNSLYIAGRMTETSILAFFEGQSLVLLGSSGSPVICPDPGEEGVEPEELELRHRAIVWMDTTLQSAIAA